MSHSLTTRRNFLKSSVAAATVPYFFSATSMAQDLPPSERVPIGLIGAGGMGRRNMLAAKDMCNVVAIADVDSERRERVNAEQCDVPAANVAYRVALDGLPAMMDHTAEQYKQHLATIQEKPSRENDLACTAMVATIKAVAGHIKDRDKRKQWALALWTAGQGREKYFGHRYRVATEPSLPYLARLAGQKMPAETELMKPILDQVASELEQSIAGERYPAQCRQLATKIAATGRYTKDAEQRRVWFESLAKIMAGNETFPPPGAKENADPLRDPCSDTIRQTLAPLQTP